MEDVFELQDSITAQVLFAIRPRLLVAEIERAQRKPTSDLQAYDHLMRAGSILGFSSAPAQRHEAQLLLEQSLARDPRFTVVRAQLAMLHAQRLQDGLGDVQDVRGGVRLAEEALADHRDDASTLALAGAAIAALGIRLLGVTVIGFRYDHAMAALSRALALAPNVFLVPMSAGFVHLCVGDADAAITHLQRAQRFDPIGPDRSTCSHGIAAAHCIGGRHEESPAMAGRAILEAPRSTAAHRLKVIVPGELGRATEAQQAARPLLELTPMLTVSRYLSVVPGKDSKLRKRCGALLKAAGTPA